MLTQHKVLNALGRHVALVGFMGAGKSTLVGPLAERLGRYGDDLDVGATDLISQHGMAQFRAQEMQRTLQHLIHCCHGDERPECPILDELAR